MLVSMDDREFFYQSNIQELIKDKNASVLVCGGGDFDKNVFERLGFTNVTISNLDSRLSEDRFKPFSWKYENAESLSFSDESFDYVVIHAAIHHASSPHKVLTEMYRTAKIASLSFEARDSMLMKLFEKTGLTQTFEHAAVYFNGCSFGGVNNTEIPNYVYRWTEREIEKCIKSYAPYCKQNFIYKYGSAFPATPELERKGEIKLYFLKFARPFYIIFTKIFPKQQNLFAFYIKKPVIQENLQPWLIFDENTKEMKFNKAWGDQKYIKVHPNDQ
jgi:ubiquinone/menaquinone biosynthesis C-methylase UbiE